MSQEPVECMVTVAETLGKDMLEMLLGEFRRSPKPWAELTETQQSDLLAGFKARVRGTVRASLYTLWSLNYPACPATLGKVSFSDDISVTVKVPKKSEHRHALADAAGTSVMVVIADPEKWLQDLDRVKTNADQGDLFAAPEGKEPATILQWPAAERPKSSLKVVETKSADAPPAPVDSTITPQPSPETNTEIPTDDGMTELAKLLQDVGYPATRALVVSLTDAQLAVTLEWAQRKKAYPETLVQMPSFLPPAPTNNAK